MKTFNKKALDAAATYSTTTSSAIDAGNIYSASVQGVSTGSATTGTLKLQGSNDMPASGAPYPTNGFTPTNWTDIASATVNFSGATTGLVPVTNICHQFLRVVFTPTAAGVQAITCLADAAGSLAGKYFLLETANGAQKYAVWFSVSGGGSAPVVSGYTAAEVAIVTGDTASAVATALGTALALLTGIASATPSTATVTVTLSTAGQFVPASDVDTGFTFANNYGTMNARIKTINV